MCTGKGLGRATRAAEMSDQRTEEASDEVRRSRYAEGAWPMRVQGGVGRDGTVAERMAVY